MSNISSVVRDDADLTSARDRAAQAICDGILKMVKDTMRLHGPDHQASDIIASGFGMAVISLGEADHNIYAMMVRAMTVR